jgi:hypothetical protein
MTDFQLPTTKADLLHDLEQGWADFYAYIGSLTPEQLTVPRDAAGWSVKDHLIHIALWQDGISALLEQKGEPRYAGMGIDAETWELELDEVNAAMQQKYRDLPLDVVLARLRAAYERMHRNITALPEAALFLPYTHYDPSMPRDNPIIGWIVGDSHEHYAEHRPWIEAIIAQGSA